MAVRVTERNTGNTYTISRGKAIGRETKPSQGVTFVGGWWVYDTPPGDDDPGDPFAFINDDAVLIIEVVDDGDGDPIAAAIAEVPSPLPSPPYSSPSVSVSTTGQPATTVHIPLGLDPAYEQIADLLASGADVSITETGPTYTSRNYPWKVGE